MNSKFSFNFLKIEAARPYYASPVVDYHQSHYPVYPPQPFAEMYRPQMFDRRFQYADESELQFRSGAGSRFLGMKQNALNALISSLRGPPGKGILFHLTLC
jgi:hypothetical protein